MFKITVAVALLTMSAAVVHAQSANPTPSPNGASQSGGAVPTGGEAGKAAASSTGSSDFATQETYKTKDGGMYQPPQQRPASPAQNLAVYGRT